MVVAGLSRPSLRVAGSSTQLPTLVNAIPKRRSRWSDLPLPRGHNAWRQGLNDLAIGHRPVTAGPNDPVELAAQRGQIGNLAVDFGEVDARNPVNRIAGLGFVIRKREQLAHRFERETEITGAADERQTR